MQAPPESPSHLHCTASVQRGGRPCRDEFSLPRAHINFRRCQEALDGVKRFGVCCSRRRGAPQSRPPGMLPDRCCLTGAA